jgi:hypothetical protein
VNVVAIWRYFYEDFKEAISFVIKFFAGVAGFLVIFIELNEVSLVEIQSGQMVHIGIVLLVEVSSVNFSMQVIMNFNEGF